MSCVFVCFVLVRYCVQNRSYNVSYLSGVDSVGTISASLVTYASVQALKPDLIINAGTAGGFKVYVCMT